MADITDPSVDHPSPNDDALAGGNGLDARGTKRARMSAAGDDDDDDDDKGGRERRKIEIKFISDKSRRHITFSKRKAGIMKKAYELSVLTGTQVLLLVVSETGLVYTFTTPKLQPLVTKPEGKNLIQACLNAPEPQTDNGVEAADVPDSPEDVNQMPPQQPGMPRGPGQVYPGYNSDQQQMYYQNLQAQQQGGQYAGMPQMPSHQRGTV